MFELGGTVDFLSFCPSRPRMCCLVHNPKQSEPTVPNSLHSACPQERDLDVPIFLKESLRSDPWEGEEARITKVSFSASSTQEQSKALEEIQIQMWIAQFHFLPYTGSTILDYKQYTGVWPTHQLVPVSRGPNQLKSAKEMI